MSASASNLAIVSPAAPPAPRRVQWIDAMAAAQRMGLTPRQVQRMAGDNWLGMGLAKLERGAKGRLVWFVRTDADKRLSPAIDGDERSVDTRRLTSSQRAEFARRLNLLNGWNEARALAIKAGKTERQATADFLLRLQLDDGTLLTRQTLFRWNKLHRQQGERGLLDARWHYDDGLGGGGGDGGAGQEDSPFVEYMKRIYLNKNRRSKAVCHDYTCIKAREEGWEIIPRRTAQRILERIPAAVVALHRGGVEEYENKVAPFLETDYSTIDSNGQWVGDHHNFDVWVRVGGEWRRPWFTGWLDKRSRMIVGYQIFVHAPNSDTIIESFGDACMAWGVPESVHIDNGEDYACKALHGETKAQRRKRMGKPKIEIGIFDELKVDVTFAIPYHPQSKTIERFFGTVAGRFSKMFPTYAGNSPQTRPDDLEEKLNRLQEPTLEDFRAAFENWLAEYHRTIHSGDSMDGRSPREVFDAHLKKRRTLTQDQYDLVFKQKVGPLKVGQAGVTYMGLTYGANALASIFGREVYIRVSTRAVETVDVYLNDKLHMAAVPSNQKMAVNTPKRALRAVMAAKKRHAKQTRELHKVKPRMSESMVDLAAREAHRIRNEEEGQPLPGSNAQVVMSPTALDEGIAAMRRAKENGGEPPLGVDTFKLLGDKFRRDDEARRAAELEADYGRDPLLGYHSSAFDDAEAENESAALANRNLIDHYGSKTNGTDAALRETA